MEINTLNILFHQIVNNYANQHIYYINEDNSADLQTYRDLENDAFSVANSLISKGLKAGDKVIICLQGNKKIINSLWGCILSGIIPTVVQSPLIISSESFVSTKILNISEILNVPKIICDNFNLEQVGIKKENIILYNELNSDTTNFNLTLNPDDIAYIQFSSGSTGNPKGITLTHKNLITNFYDIIEGLEIKSTDTVLSWMPLYHDMGLIGLFLSGFIAGSTIVNIETNDFIKDPKMWLHAMSKYKATISGSPNFGFSILLKFLNRRNEIHDWVFSSMKSLLNGAEPISVDIMENITTMLEEYNFDRKAMMPVYGLAESTLAVTFYPLMQENYICSFLSESLDSDGKAIEYESEKHKNQNFRSLVSVGVPLRNVKIKIVDDNENELPETFVGNIYVAGDAVTKKYYNVNDNETFRNSWLNTGDVGFFYKKNLFISGRKKDILFLNGKKYFSNDLEAIAVENCGYTLGKVVVVGNNKYTGHTEEVLLFASGIPISKGQEWLENTRKIFNSKIGVKIDRLIIIKSNQFPKTSSGKIQRYLLVKSYNNNDYNTIFN